MKTNWKRITAIILKCYLCVYLSQLSENIFFIFHIITKEHGQHVRSDSKPKISRTNVRWSGLICRLENGRKLASGYFPFHPLSLLLNEHFAACNCDPTGTKRDGNGTLICDAIGGQCQCKQFVIGQKCDRCAPGSFGFGQNGCSGKSNSYPGPW